MFKLLISFSLSMLTFSFCFGQNSQLEEMQYFEIVDTLNSPGIIIFDGKLKSKYYIEVTPEIKLLLSRNNIKQVVSRFSVPYLDEFEVSYLHRIITGKKYNIDCESVNKSGSVTVSPSFANKRYSYFEVYYPMLVVLVPEWLVEKERRTRGRKPNLIKEQKYVRAVTIKC